MKITLITQFLEGHGGTERVISELVNHDLKNTYQVLVPASGKPDWLQWVQRSTGYIVKICQQTSPAGQVDFITKNIRVFKPRIVLGLEGKANRLAFKIRQRFALHYKIISWGHTSILETNYFAKQDLVYSDYHLAISSGIQQQLIHLGVNPEKIFLIYNPVNVQHSELILPPQDQIFRPVFIGRILLDGQKNLRMLLEALKLLKLPWQIDIFGQGVDLSAAKRLAIKLEISKKIIWHGWVPDPWQVIKQADCLLLCSKYEGFPMVIVEALSRGLPVISTDCPTGPRDIIDQSNGILTPMDDQAAFAQACQTLYRQRNQFQRQKVQASIKKFDINHYIKQLQNIYQFVAAAPTKVTLQLKKENGSNPTATTY
ncbi:glycosyltransferase [Liquorilactobacillus sicerae]|uniref:glycosyltransferase n=1 Tax=Liquorilactobacillus sicerae TaxID=1416943 RepID=UPI00247FF1BF|nr:glycosyltransferase [Liquorilactobacillus sicerae]